VTYLDVPAQQSPQTTVAPATNHHVEEQSSPDEPRHPENPMGLQLLSLLRGVGSQALEPLLATPLICAHPCPSITPIGLYPGAPECGDRAGQALEGEADLGGSWRTLGKAK
jgi:hypothetical protein